MHFDPRFQRPQVIREHVQLVPSFALQAAKLQRYIDANPEGLKAEGYRKQLVNIAQAQQAENDLMRPQKSELGLVEVLEGE